VPNRSARIVLGGVDARTTADGSLHLSGAWTATAADSFGPRSTTKLGEKHHDERSSEEEALTPASHHLADFKNTFRRLENEHHD